MKALSELFNLVNKVSWIHDDRRKLISGLRAAKARLEINEARKRGDIEYDDDLQDFDGLGSLFQNYIPDHKRKEDDNQVGTSIDEFLSTFKGNMERIDPSELPQSHPTLLEKLEASESYGMGYYGYFSSIGDLTKVTTNLLEPFYSHEYRDREENTAEITSFVALRALEGFIDNTDIASALKCASSVERLTCAFDLMLDHKIKLKQIAEKMSNLLRECGEECTDLW